VESDTVDFDSVLAKDYSSLNCGQPAGCCLAPRKVLLRSFSDLQVRNATKNLRLGVGKKSIYVAKSMNFEEQKLPRTIAKNG
tara:strand:+ start:252 stop:497 length:246 start_codon:yes stop_codon:yes gene_type:complete